jgi:WD40 repeat protein
MRGPVVFVLQLFFCAMISAQEPKSILKHDDPVRNISLSSDGKLIAVGCSNGKRDEPGGLFIWDAKTAMKVRKLEGYAFATTGVKFTADNKHLISAGLASTVRITDVASGRDVSQLEGVKSAYGFDLLGRSGLLVVYEDSRWSAWDISNPAKPTPAKNPPNFGTEEGRACFSEDGDLLAGARNNAPKIDFPATAPADIWIWDLRKGEVLGRFKGLKDANVMLIRLSPDKRLVALGYVHDEHNLEIRQVLNGNVVFRSSQPVLPASIAFSPDGKYLAVGSGISGVLNIYDLQKLAITKSINAHSKTVQCLAFSADGKYLVSGSDDCSVKIWRFADLK